MVFFCVRDKRPLKAPQNEAARPRIGSYRTHCSIDLFKIQGPLGGSLERPFLENVCTIINVSIHIVVLPSV